MLRFNETRQHSRHYRNVTEFALPLNYWRRAHIRRSRNSSPANEVVHYSCAPTVSAATIFLVGQPRQSHRTEWSAQCHLHRIVLTQRHMPAQVLSPGVIALGKFRGRKLLPPVMFHRRQPLSANTRLPLGRPPQQVSRRRWIVSPTVRSLCKRVRPRAGAVGSQCWRGWPHPRVIGARSARSIPVVCIPTTSPVLGWPARCGGCEIGLRPDAVVTPRRPDRAVPASLPTPPLTITTSGRTRRLPSRAR